MSSQHGVYSNLSLAYSPSVFPFPAASVRLLGECTLPCLLSTCLNCASLSRFKAFQRHAYTSSLFGLDNPHNQWEK